MDAPLTVLATDPALLERYQPGPIALAIVVILAGVLWLLFRSMKRQLSRIDFDETARDDAGRATRGKEDHPAPRAAEPDTDAAGS